jgi:thiol:disulfide interchange protein
MKNILRKSVIIFLLLTATVAFAFTLNKKENKSGPNSQINFIENSWKEALKQASAQHKYIFVDAYTTWCGPCKMLRMTTFKNNKAAEFFNNNFVNVSIDVEKGQGPELASAWRIQSIPTLIICDSNGKPVYGSVGYIGAGDLIKFGKEGLSRK